MTIRTKKQPQVQVQDIKCLLSHKNQVIVEHNNIIYAFNYNKLIATRNTLTNESKLYPENIETKENERFASKFLEWLATDAWTFTKGK